MVLGRSNPVPPILARNQALAPAYWAAAILPPEAGLPAPRHLPWLSRSREAALECVAVLDPLDVEAALMALIQRRRVILTRLGLHSGAPKGGMPELA